MTEVVSMYRIVICFKDGRIKEAELENISTDDIAAVFVNAAEVDSVSISKTTD
ncbi:MAG: hypothetical protein PWQ93_374 [Clostridiales bacterium]|jgi:hypothetical protein|nr:hypothetical protein [Clostridiales bacterium]